MENPSKTKIEKRLRSKKNNALVETIIKLKKSNPVVAKELSRPKRRWPAINLKDLDSIEGDVLIAGKVLSAGELSSSKKIVAWSASKKAIEKINSSKSKFISITEEIKKNPKLENLKIVKWQK